MSKDLDNSLACPIVDIETVSITNTIIDNNQKNVKPYKDIILKISDISETNKREKFLKAIESTSKSLNIPFGLRLQKKQKQEKYKYPLQKEISQHWQELYSLILTEIYDGLTEVLDLPAISTETVKKAFVESEHPRDETGRFKDKGEQTKQVTLSTREHIKKLLNEHAEPMPKVEFTRENYNKLFPYDRINTPLGVVKLGKHQFEKLKEKSRSDLLGAVAQVLNKPMIVIQEKENVLLYAKAFAKKDGKQKTIQSVVVTIDDEQVSISTHERSVNNFVNKIKQSEQIIYRVAEQEPQGSSSGQQDGGSVSKAFPSSLLSHNLLKKSSPTKKPFFTSLKMRIRRAIKKLFGNFKLKVGGKILYNPETGEPFKREDFDRLINAIEDVLTEGTKGASKQMTVDTVTATKLLKRLEKIHSKTELESLNTENIHYKGQTFEHLRKEYKNLTTVTGEPLSQAEKMRYQVCEDTATQYITRTNDEIKGNIKQVLLDGIIGRKTRREVSQDLYNKFGELNRSWKRIADTETVNTSNLAFVLDETAGAERGEKIYFKRYEMGDACPICKKFDGVIALWSLASFTLSIILLGASLVISFISKVSLRAVKIPSGFLIPSIRFCLGINKTFSLYLSRILATSNSFCEGSAFPITFAR